MRAVCLLALAAGLAALGCQGFGESALAHVAPCLPETPIF